MAFLAIGGVTVPCTLGAPRQEAPQLIGDRMLSFSGRTRTAFRGYVRSWSLVTPPLPLAEAQGLLMALASPYPLTCSGDLFGGVQTSCVAQITGVQHRKAADGERASVAFTLTDAGPWNPMLYWLSARRVAAAGLPPGASFSRASAATYVDRDGILRLAGPNVPRVEWLDLDRDGVREHPALRLELARTNKWVRTYMFGANGLNGWSKSGDPAATLSVVDDSAALAAAGLASVVTDGMVLKLDNSAGTGPAWAGNAGTVLGDTSAHTLSAYLRGSGEARLMFTTQDGSSQNIQLSGEYVRYTQTVTPTAGDRFPMVRANPGAVVYTILPQLEVGRRALSVFPNSTATAQIRQADTLYFDLPPALSRPAPFTVYVRWIARYDGDGGLVSPGVIRIGGQDLNGTAIIIFTQAGSGNIRAAHYNGTGQSVHATTSIVPAAGDLMEAMLTFGADGSGVLVAAANGGTPSWGNLAALAPAAQWTLARAYLNAANVTGAGDYFDLLLLRGADWTLDAVRRLVG